MNVYDFDKTIYYPDAMFQFCSFCTRRHPILWFTYALILIGLAPLYALGIIKEGYMLTKIYQVTKYLKHPEKDIELFWKKHEKNMQEWYLKIKQPTDLIISASPIYLIKPMTDKLGVKLIATEVDLKTGKVIKGIMKNQGKSRYILDQDMPVIDNFYSDSLSDTPIALLSEHAYLVKKDEIVPWPHIKDIISKHLYKRMKY